MKGQGPKAVQSRIDSDYSWTPNPIEAALPLVANAGTYPAEAPAFRSGTGIRCHVLLVHPRRTDTAHHKLYLAEELDEGMTGTDPSEAPEFPTGRVKDAHPRKGGVTRSVNAEHPKDPGRIKGIPSPWPIQSVEAALILA